MRKAHDRTTDLDEKDPTRKGLFFRTLRSIVTLRGSPEAIALGTSIGMFVAFTPTIGFQMLISAFIATLFRASRPASMIPPWITNPITIPPVFAGTYWLGSLFWSGPSASEVYTRLISAIKGMERFGWYEIVRQFKEFMRLGADLFIPMLIGGILVGTVASLLTYPTVLWAVREYRRKLRRIRRKRSDPEDKTRYVGPKDKGDPPSETGS